MTRARVDRLAAALTVTHVEKRGIVFDDRHPAASAFILLSGVARITCRNRKGERVLVIMVAPGMIPGVPPEVVGVTYQFRCEAITDCQVGTVAVENFVEICLGITSENFRSMAASYLGRWDLVQLRCSNFMNCTLEERLALTLLELAENFGIPDKLGVRLNVTARHQDLAELVGASRPRVTEHLLRFEREKWIIRDERRFVINTECLEAFLEQTHAAGGSGRRKAKR